MNHPRTWSPRRRAGIAACGLAVAAVVAVPAAAWAESSPPSATAPATSTTAAAGPSTCTPAQRWDALAAAAPKIATYLDAHPDLSAELQTLKALPKDQRAAASKTYFTAHPDERTAFRDARAGLRTFRATCHG
ncbi:hemophore-related protein [Rhodococcus antarcticus]|uniref:Hemophore-related protein n=1 Tax=Rhodococcus antarcticus TaxID=2987751 RepID=A0ABY6P098_9NOCA|nr:hemophore-related protein [Rhodococcus antarcticus]UZJ25090.1 hemophore-related protein [Rhodococcus antarcticus]